MLKYNEVEYELIIGRRSKCTDKGVRITSEDYYLDDEMVSTHHFVEPLSHLAMRVYAEHIGIQEMSKRESFAGSSYVFWMWDGALQMLNMTTGVIDVCDFRKDIELALQFDGASVVRAAELMRENKCLLIMEDGCNYIHLGRRKGTSVGISYDFAQGLDIEGVFVDGVFVNADALEKCMYVHGAEKYIADIIVALDDEEEP